MFILIALLLAGHAPAPASAPPAPAAAPDAPKAPARLWTWTLYPGPKSVSLAHEVPDTNALGEVLQCQAGSGQVTVEFYPAGATRPQDKLTAPLAVRDAAFQAFVKTGRLAVKTGERSAEITVPDKDRPKLDRFAQLCGT